MGESFSVREAISGFVSLFGVVLIARPPFIFGHGWDSSHTPAGPDAITRVRTPATPAEGDDDDTARMIGITWALVGVCFASSAYLSIRYIGKRANAFHSIGYFSMMCTLATGM
jgi:drug/metabolite transporter (DMT)-like permease